MNKEEVKLSLENSKVRVHEKTNGRGEIRKMKLYIDLDKNESLSYRNVIGSLKPEDVKENAFIKSIFLLGLGTYVDKLKEIKEKYEAEHGSIMNLDSSGVPNVPSNVEIVS